MTGTRLRRLRVAKGLTQKDLATPRYTHAYVSTIEAGRRRPSQEALEFFASKLEVGLEELLTGRPPDLAARLELRLQEARVTLSSGRITDSDASFQAIAKEARRFTLARIEAKALEGRGLGQERHGDPETALELYQRAEEVLHSEPATARADALVGKARCFQALGDVRYAIYIVESLIDELDREKLHDPDALSRLHAAAVYCYLDLGLHAKAAESAAELERLAPRVTDASRVAQMHMNVARLYLTQGRIGDAERSLQRAEDAYRQLDLRTEMGGAYLARGYVLSREGRLQEARRELEEARAIFEETADDKDLTRTLNELARVERVEGRLDRAQGLLERSIALLGVNDTPILAWAHRELGLVLVDRDPATAEKNYRLAIELYERAEQAVDIAVTYRALGDLLGARGESGAASDAYRTGILALEPHL